MRSRRQDRAVSSSWGLLMMPAYGHPTPSVGEGGAGARPVVVTPLATADHPSPYPLPQGERASLFATSFCYHGAIQRFGRLRSFRWLVINGCHFVGANMPRLRLVPASPDRLWV